MMKKNKKNSILRSVFLFLKMSIDFSRLDSLCAEFNDNYNFIKAVNLSRFLRANSLHHMNILFCTYIIDKLGINIDILDELGISQYYTEKYGESFDTFSMALDQPTLSPEKIKHLAFNQHFSAFKIQDRFSNYNEELVKKICSRQKRDNEIITFSMTTCKRFDLFYKTMNSFINSVKDLDKIGEWIIIDDNSDESELQKVQSLYPFLNIIRKGIDKKGHPTSMNMIKDYVKTPYLFHMEDDWMIYKPDFYLTKCLNVLANNEKYGQCLININYSETPEDEIPGGFQKITRTGVIYYEHQYIPDETERIKALGYRGNCAYWPHFSFRPSLVKTRIFKEIGDFKTNVGHFEMEYAYRYISKGYISTFLPGVVSRHTGRLTKERFDNTKINAYTLNNEDQFVKKSQEEKNNEKKELTTSKEINSMAKIKNIIINLDRRPDRYEKFLKESVKTGINFERYSAVDGKLLKWTRQMDSIFDTCDYSYRRGIVGCALSHIDLTIKLLQDNEYDVYFIVEDDIEFTDDFTQKYKLVLDQLISKDWGICYLGHHYYHSQKNEHNQSRTITPEIEKLSVTESLRKSMGGTFGYLINKKGAKILLDYISRTGMVNAIDTMQQKTGDLMGVYYSVPNIIFSELQDSNSDIQSRYDNLKLTDEEKYNQTIIELKDKKVSYEVSEVPEGLGWWVNAKYINIPCEFSDDLIYKDRLKKYDPTTKNYEYNILDSIKY